MAAAPRRPLAMPVRGSSATTTGTVGRGAATTAGRSSTSGGAGDSGSSVVVGGGVVGGGATGIVVVVVVGAETGAGISTGGGMGSFSMRTTATSPARTSATTTRGSIMNPGGAAISRTA